MPLSIIEAQREILLGAIRHITRGDWKVLIVDADSRRLLDNVLEQDAILNENVTHIEQITDRRKPNRETEALYFLTPQPHIVDSLMADFEKRRYARAHLVWTSLLHPALRDRIDKSHTAREQIALFRVLNVDFFPRESHLVTFRSPWSFPILFHPACSPLVRQHMQDLAQKIVGVCVALGEYPTIRYYRPRAIAASHDAAILCSHLARFVQDELDLYAKFHDDFPPASNARPRGVLYILDRSIDLFAPFVHEFTYQAMAHDLLTIREGADSKLTYRTVLNENTPAQQDKDIEIREADKIWTDNRHRHMKDTIDRLMADFHRFIADNPNFTKASEGGANSLNAIKDMMAGLPEFQSRKEAYALHLGMAQESMNRFQRGKLADLASVEQTLATGLDEEGKKATRGLADQVVRMLDEPAITPPDRLRLLILYLLSSNSGLLPGDLQKLLAHAQLPSRDAQLILNLALLGVRTTRKLKDPSPPPPAPPIFPPKVPGAPVQDEHALSRFEPALHALLEAHAKASLDPTVFPYTKPPLDLEDGLISSTLPGGRRSNSTGPGAAGAAATSLRTQKPTWAKSTPRNGGASSTAAEDTRQRVLVFIAGGATYSEARACYTVGRKINRECVLITSHMLTPAGFMAQVGLLSEPGRAMLGIPDEVLGEGKRSAPRYLWEDDEEDRVSQHGRGGAESGAVGVGPNVSGTQSLSTGSGRRDPGAVQGRGQQAQGRDRERGREKTPMAPPPLPTTAPQYQQQVQANSSAKLTKEPPTPDKKEKKRHFFGGKKG